MSGFIKPDALISQLARPLIFYALMTKNQKFIANFKYISHVVILVFLLLTLSR